MRTSLPISLPVLVLCAVVDASAAPSQAPVRPEALPMSGAPAWELPLPESRRKPATDPDERISVYVVLEGRAALEAVPQGVAGDSEEARAAVRQEVKRLRSVHRVMARRLMDMGARVEADLVRLANVLQVNVTVRNAERIAGMPGVIKVERVPRYERALKSAVPFVGAPALWGNPGLPVTGKGIRVGIIDTGIDYLHADFGGPGTPEAYQQNDRAVIEPGSFPTAKVVGGWDFVGDDYTGQNSPVPDEDPLDCARMQSQYISGGHGTHVAGIAAGMGVLADGTPFSGPYEASYDPSIFRVGPGVAPEALLYALRIFGCDGSTAMVAAALEWAVDPDDDPDTDDRLDVVNMSLGGAYGLATTTDEKVVANLAAAGTTIVVAAGNDGDAFYVTGEPSTYTQVLSVAATTDVVTYLAMSVKAPGSIAGEYACAEGAFSQPLSESGPITGQLVATQPANACGTLTNGGALQGKIAFIDRGSCYFVDKVQRAFDAGAVAAVVANDAAGEPPFSMAGNGGATVAIPSVMIAKPDGDTIRGKLSEGVTATLDGSNYFSSSANADQMAEFSSRGPRSSDNRLKPDITAPGVSIDSAGVGSGNGPQDMSGTSMACPMAAGGAALVRQANPSFGPYDVKAAMMNTAGAVTDGAGIIVPASFTGAGRMRLDRAALTKVLARTDEVEGAVSVSFGSIVTAEPATSTRQVVLENRGDESVTLEAVVEPAFVPAGVQVMVEPSSVQVPGKGTATVAVTLSVDPIALPIEAPDPYTPPTMSLGGSQAYARHFLTEASGQISFRAPGDSADDGVRVPFYGVVRAGSELKAELATKCEGGGSDDLEIPIQGASAHREPVTSAFQLVATSPTKPLQNAEDAATDLTVVGVASNVATATSFDKVSVYFGLAVAGAWTTPAKGQLSLVAVAIDTTGDDKVDYLVYAEPLSREGPYADVLTATTYRLSNGEAVGRRFLNLVPRDVYNTEPFNNSVVVLPVSLSTLGLTEGATGFQFYALTQGLTFPQTKDSTAWISYDPYHAPIDTAQGGPDGIPFYPGLGPVKVHIDEQEAGDGPLPSILLLFHSNIQGQRWGIVDPAATTTVPPSDLRVATDAPDRVKENATAELTWTVSNAGAEIATGARLGVSITGAAGIAEVTASQGTCSTTATSIECTPGDLAAGGTLEVTAQVTAGKQDIHVLAAAGTVPSCDTSPDDNQSSKTVQVGEAETSGAGGSGPAIRDRAIDAYAPGGGCACEAGRHGGGAAGAAAGVLAMAALATGRRRRRMGLRR